MNSENKVYALIGAAYVAAIGWGIYNTYLMSQVVKTNRQILSK